ncbi:TolC family protein [Clostridium butyricum]|nr:TolC family protein [Clostridium butyricum]
MDDYLSYTQEIYELDKDYWNDDDNSGVVKNTEISNAKDDQDKAYKTMIEKKNAWINATDEEKAAAKDAFDEAQEKYKDSIEEYGKKLSGRITYLTQKYTLDATESNLLDAKKSCKEGLRTIYMNMKNLEDSIDLLQQNIDYTNKNLRIAKINYDLGLSTELTYKLDLCINLRKFTIGF